MPLCPDSLLNIDRWYASIAAIFRLFLFLSLSLLLFIDFQRQIRIDREAKRKKIETTSFNMIYGSINLTNLKAIFSFAFRFLHFFSQIKKNGKRKKQNKTKNTPNRYSFACYCAAQSVCTLTHFQACHFYIAMNPSNRILPKKWNAFWKSFGFAYFIHFMQFLARLHTTQNLLAIFNIGNHSKLSLFFSILIHIIEEFENHAMHSKHIHTCIQLIDKNKEKLCCLVVSVHQT